MVVVVVVGGEVFVVVDGGEIVVKGTVAEGDVHDASTTRAASNVGRTGLSARGRNRIGPGTLKPAPPSLKAGPEPGAKGGDAGPMPGREAG